VDVSHSIEFGRHKRIGRHKAAAKGKPRVNSPALEIPVSSHCLTILRSFRCPSIHPRRSANVKVPTFFEPVHFHLQFPDLLIELGLHLLVGFGLTRVRGEMRVLPKQATPR